MLQQIKDNLNLVIIISIFLAIILLISYFAIVEKQKPSSIDDFIAKVKKTKSPALNAITSKNLKKLEISKVKEIDTKDPFNYNKKSIEAPKKVAKGITSNLAIDEIKFVGTMDVNGSKIAFLKMPDNRVYKFYKGDFISKESAKIYKIDETQMVLIVNSQDIRGSWITDKKVLKLKSKIKENL